MDHAVACNDCGMTLVESSALGTEETARAVEDWHAQRELAASALAGEAPGGSGTAANNVDVATGFGLIALSVALLAVSWFVAASVGGGVYWIAIGPFLAGLMRLSRSGGKQRRGR